MSEYSLRPACSEDSSTIRKIIYQAGINPMDLHWERFTLAVNDGGQIIGCGQIKVHRDGSRELASIAVIETWRNQGVASQIIRRLMDQEAGRLYLTCRTGLGPFYQRFGFRQATRAELPPYFRRVSRFVHLFRVLHLMPREGLLIMVWDEL
jgi:N-acetylglutamate synthase-like GNAT family acetyltransferase